MANGNIEALGRKVCESVTLSITDDTDATLIADLGTKKVAGVVAKEQNFSSGAKINYMVVNATGTSVVINCSLSVNSALGTATFLVFLED